MKANINTEKEIFEVEFNDSDFYSLDYTLAYVIHPALVKFKEHKYRGYPHPLSEEEWEKILDKMILAFELIIKGTGWEIDRKKSYQVKEGLRLFGEWYTNLWT